MRSPSRPTPDGIGIRRKILFYCSRQSSVVSSHPSYLEGEDFDFAEDRRPTTVYFGLSRCTTFTRYPALRRRLPTSSAIMTERCCPPVQPKEMVR
jgi:hypothetical protein